MKIISFILFFVFFVIVPSLADSLSKKTIINGNERISKETILVYSKIDDFSFIDDRVLDEILKNLYETMFFEKISIKYDNNQIYIDLKENPIIQTLSFKGVKSKSLLEKITSNINSKERFSYNEYFLELDKNIILDNLKNSGYFFAKIDVLVENLENNKVNINYLIDIGEKAKIKKITFLGDKIYKDQKLHSLIVSEEYRFWKIISGKKYLNKEMIKLDERLLRNFYLNNGYFNVKINSSFAKLTNDNQFELIYNIEPNEKIYFNDFSIQLPDDFNYSNFKSLENVFNKLKDQPYSLDRIKKILDEIDNIILNEEFASIQSSVTEEVIFDKINLNFIIEKTENFYIKKINIFGNNVTRENVIRNQFEIDEGDPFNEILFSKSINNLKSLNFFSDIESDISTDDDNYKEINIYLEEKPTGEIMAGAGFGTSGASFIAGIKENNYLGKGISFNSNIEINENSVKGIVGIFNPNINNTDNSGYLNVEMSETDKLNLYGYKSNKTGFSFGTGFEYLNDLNLTLGTSSYYEKIETSSSATALRQSQKGNYWDTFLKIDLDYDKRNQKFQTSEGFRSFYSLDIPLLSKNNTFINEYTYDFYKELYENNITTFSFSLGSSKSLSGDNIKLSERLYIPGRKLRGFEIGKVGPKDGNDFIGGNYFSSVNISSTIPQLLPNSQSTDFVMFFDAANLWGVDYNDSLDTNKIRTSIGFGLDWWTPVGPLSLTLSEALTKSNSDVVESFRFNIGTTF